MSYNKFGINHITNFEYYYVFIRRVEINLDTDQMALSEASRSGSTVFSKKDKSGLSKTMVKGDKS